MIKKTLQVTVALGVIAATAPALATTMTLRNAPNGLLSSMVDNRPLVTTTLDNNDPRYRISPSERNGLVRIGVNGFTCSGTVVGKRHILTAAHCVDKVNDGVKDGDVQVWFGGGHPVTGGSVAGGGPFVGRPADARSQKIEVNPLYYHPIFGGGAGNPVVGIGDIAIVTLQSDVPAGTKIHGLYTEDAKGKTVDIFGFGARGTQVDNIFDLVAVHAGRKAKNVFDASYEEIFNDFNDAAVAALFPDLLELVLNSQLIYDFDALPPTVDLFFGEEVDGISWWDGLINGAGIIDPFNDIEKLVVVPNFSIFKPGVGEDEGLIAGGDSGGPSFVNGLIAGVHSFGTSLNPDFCDGTADEQVFNMVDQICGNNSSFGDIAGDTNVALYASWIKVAIPEPASMALFGFGLAGLMAARRRKAS